WARRHGFSRQYVRRVVQKDVVRLIDGQGDPAEAVAVLEGIREPARALRRARPAQAKPKGQSATVQAKSGSSGTEPLSLAQSGDLPTLLMKTRIKSEAERGKLLELKAKVEAGKYVDDDEVRVAAFNKGRTTRDNLLNIPDRLSGMLAAEGDARKIHTLLTAEMRQAMEDLTGGTDGG
ncbi:MAG: hypothetical protein GY778_25305, partial [bacterium]|nr:hypothetical protein [bacterium]